MDLTTLAVSTKSRQKSPGGDRSSPDVARHIVDEASDSEWRIIPVDENGQPVGVITTNRRPTIVQKRIVETGNPTCVFPGCRTPAGQCDLNDEIPWAQAHRTTIRELRPLCRHHHNNHHQHGWKQKQTKPGTYTWTSPLGHTYTPGPDPP